MTTNAAVPALLTLYPGFWCQRVAARRAINRDGSGRTGAHGFSWIDQEALAATLRRWADQGGSQ